MPRAGPEVVLAAGRSTAARQRTELKLGLVQVVGGGRRTKSIRGNAVVALRTSLDRMPGSAWCSRAKSRLARKRRQSPYVVVYSTGMTAYLPTSAIRAS